MNEYKETVAIKSELQKICDRCWHPHRLGGCPEHCGVNDAIKAIDSIPSADVVSVVRCKDCKYYYNINPERIATANIICHQMHENDYCSYAERLGLKNGRSS